MSSKTKIVVLRMKEVIYTGIFIGLALLLLILCFIMFRPAKKEASTSSGLYIPGLYSASLTLGNEQVNVEVTVDSDQILDVSLVHLNEAVSTMYPLMQPSMEELEEILGNIIRSRRVYLEKVYPYTQAGKLQSIRKYGQLLSEEYTEEGIKVTAYVPAELFAGLYTDIPEK